VIARWLARRWIRLRADDDWGFSTLEAVIVIPVAVFLMLIVVQFAMLWHARHVAQAAAQDGLRAARSYHATGADGKTEADAYLSKIAPRLLSGARVTVDRGANTVTVYVRAEVSSLVPFASFTVSESAAGPVEKYQTTP
jgi:Flp pilus assembly protein TadG